MSVSLEGVSKVFPGGVVGVSGIDLQADPGELLVLVGPSGSGKSTLLRMVAGLEVPTEGRVRIAGEDVTDLGPERRDVAMVFQSYALYPHMTVRENLAFPLRVRRRPTAEVTDRVARAAEQLDIADLLDRKPAQLSGGQRQRVAVGRAVVRRPKAFLLDEPLSNLDVALRLQTRTELARLHRSLGVTTLYVTHDQEEAMTLGDRVAVLRAGRLEQVAAPMELYRRPATRFVASFIGSPAMSFFECAVEPAEGGVLLVAERAALALRLTAGFPETVDAARVLVGIRPHDIRPVREGERPDAEGLVELVEPRGADVVVRIALPSGRTKPDGPGAGEDRADGPAPLAVVLPADANVRVGDPLAVVLPRERLHFFDVKTGDRLG